MSSVRPATDGWHWKEWGAELAGTAVLLFAVVTAKYWAVRAGPPYSDPTTRVTIVGTVAGLVVVGVAFSPLGRRSGAHLNPAVTIGLWLQKVTGRADLAGYCTAQIIGWHRRGRDCPRMGTAGGRYGGALGGDRACSQDERGSSSSRRGRRHVRSACAGLRGAGQPPLPPVGTSSRGRLADDIYRGPGPGQRGRIQPGPRPGTRRPGQRLSSDLDLPGRPGRRKCGSGSCSYCLGKATCHRQALP